MILDFNPAAVVAKAIERGWVMPSARSSGTAVKIALDKRQLASRAWHARKREEYRFSGLNAQGKPYVPRVPKIKGLAKNHTEYMRAWRRLKKTV